MTLFHRSIVSPCCMMALRTDNLLPTPCDIETKDVQDSGSFIVEK